MKNNGVLYLIKTRIKEEYHTTPVELSESDKKIILYVSSGIQKLIEENYVLGFGATPSGKDEDYANEVWTRDAGHEIGNYLARNNPKEALETLEEIFKHQREDGALPFKIEETIGIIQMIPGCSGLAKCLFNLIEVKGKNRTERPLYEGQECSGAEDTIPAITIAVGELFLNSKEGQDFITKHFDQMKKAIDFFRRKTDPEDGLAIVTKDNPDWADSLYRKGKLGNINILWARSLRLMEFMAKKLNRPEESRAYLEEYKKVKHSVMEKLYNKEEGYFRAKAGEDRLDTVASIFGSLYLLNAEEAVRVEENLEKKVKRSSGLQNFHPPYSRKEIYWVHNAVNHHHYHNKLVWPWVTCQNIQVKIKIALQHRDEVTRNKYKREAINDLLEMSKLFKNAGGAYEIFEPDEPKPASSKFLGITVYKPPRNFTGSLAAYQESYRQLKELGWIE